MCKLLLLVWFFLGSCVAVAAPKKPDAEAWGQDFRSVRSKVTNALAMKAAWGTKRGALRGEIKAMQQRAKRMWGEASNCERSAEALGLAFEFTHDAVGSNEYIAVTGAVQQAFESGQAWAACSNEIDKAK